MSIYTSVAYHCDLCGSTSPVDSHPHHMYKCFPCDNPYVLSKTVAVGSEHRPHFPKAAIIQSRPGSLWRYREMIPVDRDASIVTLGEGLTPLLPFVHSPDTPETSVRHFLKLDFVFPTGSYKDRGASVLISKIKELGVRKVIEDSSGNAGAAIAAYGARAGLDVTIYSPASTSPGKLAQIQMAGARLELVQGSRADTTVAILDKTASVFYASHNWNPFFMEGVKTLAFEICEQLAWTAPQHVICPLGFGSIYLALFLGFSELKAAGVISALPQLHGVQPSACAPIHKAVHLGNVQRSALAPGEELPDVVQASSSSVYPKVERFPLTHATLAEGITAEIPMRGNAIVKAMAECRGCSVLVREPEIERGIAVLAKQGVYAEPTSSVVVAAFTRLVASGVISPGSSDKVVSVLSGSGLKATDKMVKLLSH